MKVIETERLILRTWQDEDVEKFYLINQDPKVNQFLRGPLTINEVKDFILSKNNQQLKRSYSLWATCLKETNELIGFVGLNYIEWQANFTPAVEVGWRLGSQYWSNGYATEGALASLEYGFNKIGLDEMISFTAINNKRSLDAMERLGMQRDFKNDFAHPTLPADNILSKHILYRLTKDFHRKN